jgi:hypothetical protein
MKIHQAVQKIPIDTLSLKLAMLLGCFHATLNNLVTMIIAVALVTTVTSGKYSM